MTSTHYSDGKEHIKYVVSLQVQKGFHNRRPFWKALESSVVRPPVQAGPFHDYLLGVAARHDVDLPAVMAVFRNQAYGEDPGFHYIVKAEVSETDFHILKTYAGTRGIPHSRREDDFPWKFNSLPGFRFDIRRLKPVDPAARLVRFPDPPALGTEGPTPRRIREIGTQGDRLSSVNARF